MAKKKIMQSSWEKWYEANKDQLSASRKKRYAEDPAYRKKALAQAAANRIKRAKGKPVKKELSTHPYTQLEAAAVLGMANVTVREWMLKGYFPRPKMFKRMFVFTNNQLTLLEKLRDFLREKGTKVGVNSDEFADLLAFIKVNW